MIDLGGVSSCIHIPGGAKAWSALSIWTPEYFAKRFGQIPVDVMVSDNGSLRWNADGSAPDPKSQFELSNIVIAEAIALIMGSESGGPRFYIQQQSLLDTVPELISDLEFNLKRSSVINLWIGSARNVIPLHFDLSPNVFVQVYGEKTFTVFSPDETPFLYQNPVGSRMFHLSQMDLTQTDFEAFPLFKQARGAKYKLMPGDIFFMPAGWWHFVESDTVSISVNHWHGVDAD